MANIPGAVPKTATEALSSQTMPYAVMIANGLSRALENNTIATGVNVYRGNLTEEAVAKSLNMTYTALGDAIDTVEV